ncbi:MAG: anthranilate phosphoribosyltransferase [Chthonomonadaceae bacterium]|nr:anthranilate phosphoribosyltransferase [Chthonomonadaceae bacterium]
MGPQEAIRRVTAGGSLTREEAEQVASALMQGQATPAQIGALLVALRMKGETVEEVAGFAAAMRQHVVPVRTLRQPLIDTCGTGGSTFRVFNVSTAAAFVTAAAGLAVAKHGNRRVTGICGSADVLEALGVTIDLDPPSCAACIDAVGIGFLFAPNHHPALKHVGGPRREIGVRSLFNLLGPLTNPAGASRQVMGVYEASACRLACGALQRLGCERAIVVHAAIGLDEIATIGETSVCELRGGEILEYTLTPERLGLQGADPHPADLAPADTPAGNAMLMREVLSGKAETQAQKARRDLVAVNAAAALRVGDLVEDWPEAVQRAQRILATGAARDVLEQLIAFQRASS